MNIGIIGLGLMGASFGRALIKYTNNVVYGYDIDETSMLKANLLGAINIPLTKENAKELDVLVIAVFPKLFKSVAKEYLPYLKDGATLMDFCGVKKSILKSMKEFAVEYEKLNFIGAHPMAGKEFSGINHSTPLLFNKASMLLTPIKTDIFNESEIKNLFLSVGFGEVIITDGETHDKNIAFTSQMCHIVSNAFIKSPTAEKHFGYSAGSYKDLTRVARMNPEMWTDLVMQNKENVLYELEIFIENVEKYKNAIANNDEETLKQLFKEGNDKKLEIDLGRKK